MNEKARVLIIDDDRAVCSSLVLLLKTKGYHATAVHHPSIVLDKIQEFKPALILLDMNFTIDTSGKQGLALLKKIKEFDESLIVILMTGWATLQLAVEGMKLGAKDFLAKPWDNKHLLNSIDTALSLASGNLPSRIQNNEGLESIIGKDPKILNVLDMVHRVAPTDASVLITGESGTGKELIAEAVHYQSKRKDNPFVKVNLGGISSTLFESEMFGHTKGAFTDAVADREGRFTKAHSGTIFLDEIGDLPLSNQVKLLRVLQENQYEVLGSSVTRKSDVRVVSATNKNLMGMVNDALFREDLFYRINLITLKIPALRERRKDIPLLVDHFIRSLNARYDLDVYLEDEVKEWLSNQDYPGNIRQLKNVVERTILLAENKNRIDIKNFHPHFTNDNLHTDRITLPDVGTVSLEEIEKKMILKALNFHNFNISKTSSSLGISRNALYRRMEKYDIPYEH